MHAQRIGAAVLAGVFLGACGNPCPAVCDNMADLARECGFSVGQGAIDECAEAQADASPEDRDVCRDRGSALAIRESWDCLELERYFSDPSAR